MSRTKSSIINFTTAVVGQVIGLFASFISRIFFIKILGSQYLGLNGLFTNILTVLSLAELGVGSAITYSLYKPLAENDIKKCKMLMQLYKKIYIVIGVFIVFTGIVITPFLSIFINDVPQIEHINLIFMLFVINTSVSYFFSYKRNLIIADQNRYIATIYRYGFYVLLNIIQVIYLMLFKDYIGFLILQIIATLLENITISIKANKMYPYLKDKDKVKLDKKIKSEIISNTKAMMMHKIGGTIVSSTDNIILAKFVSLSAVGLYSNYYMVIYALNLFFIQLYNSIIPSIGNLWVTSNEEKRYSTFKKIDLLTFWIISFSTICLLCLYNQFIEIWVGKEYLFTFDIVIVLVINYYITGMRRSVLAFRDATGLFYKDRWKSIIEAIINLIVSIILALKYGVVGVFIGTFISSITICFWIEPYILFKYGFHKKPEKYFINYAKKTILTICVALITYLLCSFAKGNIYFSFCIKLLICFLVPNIIYIIIYRNTDEFNYFYEKIHIKVSEILNKKN